METTKATLDNQQELDEFRIKLKKAYEKLLEAKRRESQATFIKEFEKSFRGKELILENTSK